MDQQGTSMPREETIAIMSDVVMYGTAVTISVIQIDESGRPVSTWARVSPPCLTIRDGVPEIRHAAPCGCIPLQPVAAPGV